MRKGLHPTKFKTFVLLKNGGGFFFEQSLLKKKNSILVSERDIYTHSVWNKRQKKIK